MRRLILSQLLDPAAEVLGMCASDARVLTTINEAQERLLNRSLDPVGSWMRFKVCVGSSDCMVLPREVRTIKAWWLCNEPGVFVNEWYEAVGWWNGGMGLQDSDGFAGLTLIDRGTACAFDNVIATTSEPRKIQAVASNSSDNGKLITLRYFDSNGNRVYTSIDGEVQEGEQLVLSTSGTLTASNVMTNGLYHVVKAVTNYPVRLYSYDTNSGTQSSLLALYAPGETTPIYRKVFLPGLTDMGACEGASDDCSVNKAVTIAARLQHVPVVVGNDPLVIGNLPALLDMVRAIQLRKRNEFEMASAMESNAMRELDGELAAYLGDGMVPTLRMASSATWGGGGIMNAI